jgi:hypothetical protein
MLASIFIATAPLRAIIRDAKIVAQVQLVQAHGTAPPDFRVAIHVKNDRAANSWRTRLRWFNREVSR